MEYRTGMTVLWDHYWWTVHQVNTDQKGEVYSLGLSRPGVTTCVSPGDVEVALAAPPQAARGDEG